MLNYDRRQRRIRKTRTPAEVPQASRDDGQAGNAMKLDFDDHGARKTIGAYSTAGITVDGAVLTEPFVLVGDRLVTNTLPRTIAEFDTAALRDLIAFDQSIIILGTGASQVLLDDKILSAAFERAIGVEVMTTPAACRCYNVLVAENRAVVGAFYML
jgi:uncharacterized protein